MRKHFTKFLALTTVAVTAAVFTGCSSEDEPFADFESKMEVENPVSRAVVQGDSTIITFDDFESTMMAMPTSYGELLATYVQTLADYRNGKKQDPVTTWTYWPINQANVKTVKLNFSGSDTGDYGLNTPAYICLDDITIE